MFRIFFFFFLKKKWPVKLSITINKETHSLIINLFFYSDSSLSHRTSHDTQVTQINLIIIKAKKQKFTV